MRRGYVKRFTWTDRDIKVMADAIYWDLFGEWQSRAGVDSLAMLKDIPETEKQNYVLRESPPVIYAVDHYREFVQRIYEEIHESIPSALKASKPTGR